MFFIDAFFIVVLGIIFGSLWSVLLERLQDKHDRKTIKSILIGRSQCPKCKHTLWRKELIPLASYLIQRGKCKHCKTHISAEYPILELASGTIFLISYRALYHTDTDMTVVYEIPKLIFWIVTNWLLMLLLIHDCKTYELHMPIWALLMIRIRGRQFSGQIGNYQEWIIGLIICLVLFWAIYLFGKRYVKKRFHSDEEGFGQGDIFIGATLWSLFPFIGSINNVQIDWITGSKIAVLMVILGCIIGLIYFVGEVLIQKKQEHKKNTQDLFNQWRTSNKIIPFIPSLILAFWILLIKASLLLGLVF